jgi:hypothetical protein
MLFSGLFQRGSLSVAGWNWLFNRSSGSQHKSRRTELTRIKVQAERGMERGGMHRYPTDLDPRRLTEWLLDEDHLRKFDLNVRTTRSFEAREMGSADTEGLDDSDIEDARDISEIGILEVAPRRTANKWVLRVRVEDNVGPRVPEDESVSEEEEELDLDGFHADFIRDDRGLTEVTAEVENSASGADLDRLLQEVTRGAR